MARTARQGLGTRFRRFWLASAGSQLGDGVRITALPLLAAAITSDPLPVAAVSGAVWLPWLLFAVIGGVVVDRVDRRRLMELGQLARMVLMLGLAAAVLVSEEAIWLLIAVAFLIGVGEVFVDSALQAVVPRLVEESRLDAANGRMGTAQLLGNELAGPPIGGLLFIAAHAVPFLVDAASFAASGLLLATLDGDFAPRRGDPLSSAWQDMKEGVSWLFHHRVLRSIAVAIGVVNLGWMAFGAVLVLFARQVLGLNGLGYGLVFSCAAAGGLLGSLLATRVTRRLGRARSIVLALALSGILAGSVGFTSDPFVAGILQFATGIGVAVVNVSGWTLRQVLTPDRLLGRVVSASRIVGYGLTPVGAAAGGAIGHVFGLRAPFFVGGGLILVASLALGTVLNERKVAEARAWAADASTT